MRQMHALGEQRHHQDHAQGKKRNRLLQVHHATTLPLRLSAFDTCNSKVPATE